MSIKINNRPAHRPEKNFTKKQIQYAIASTPSMKQAALYLNTSYQTFKKYASRYDLFKPLKSNKGIRRPSFVGKFGQHDIQAILSGENPNPFRETTLLKKAIREAYMKACCDNCNTDFQYWTQKKPEPLVLDFLDRNPQNTKQDNLRILCFNCVYELQTTHKGWYRHRETPISKVVDEILPKKDIVHRDDEPELEYIPFENFQKTLEN